jgi:hypothetical protein
VYECDACHEVIDEADIGGRVGYITVCRDCIETAEPVKVIA